MEQQQSQSRTSITDPNIIYYGPFPCENCGRAVVRMERERGGTVLDAQPEGFSQMIYPNNTTGLNRVWQLHSCKPQEINPGVLQQDRPSLVLFGFDVLDVAAALSDLRAEHMAGNSGPMACSYELWAAGKYLAQIRAHQELLASNQVGGQYAEQEAPAPQTPRRTDIPMGNPPGDPTGGIVGIGESVKQAGERRRVEFVRGVQQAINRSSLENGSGTPDWILAELLADMLSAWDKAVQKRAKWSSGPDGYITAEPAQ